jgi:nucleotide-binding universal stress UspA family protein
VYDTVLIPTDGSEVSLQAVEHGAKLAEFHGASVRVLYVVDATSFKGMGTETVGSDPINSAVNDGEDIVAEAAETIRDHGVTVTTAVRQGMPEETILSYLGDEDIDVIVMGTHGRSGIQRYLKGSVTEQVVRSSPTPVLTLSGTDR